MKIGIMQPYFLPYIGYWQLINAVDKYVVYDNIQYTKKGWFNRNRFLQNGKDEIFTVSLAKDSDYLDVRDRKISPVYDRNKLISQLKNAYFKAPFFAKNFPLFEEIINYPEDNLFLYIYNSITKLCQFLDIKTQIIVSSSVPANHSLKAEHKVLSICEALHGDNYINAIGGVELYDKVMFAQQGINLNFIKTRPIKYAQFNNEFVPNLSIVDVLMFNSKEAVQEMLQEYDLI